MNKHKCCKKNRITMSPGEENYLDSGKICRKYCRHLASIFPNGGHGSAKRTVFIAVGSNQ